MGIVGVNGAGKTTLLRAFAGDVALSGGRRKLGKTVSLAFLSQEVRELERLMDRRVIDAVEEVSSVTRLGGKEVTASQLAQTLGFTGARQQTRVGDLSGGERRRLQLLRLLMAEPNVLFLDEPTNDLDIETLTSLEDVLDGWAGTLLVVSHDRYLLERVADRQVALLGDGKVRELPGGVDQYLELRAATRVPAPAVKSVAAQRDSQSAVPSGASAALSPAQVRAARKELARIERRLDRLGTDEATLHEQLAASAADHVAATRLNDQLRALLAERERLEGQWLESAEAAE